MAESPIPELFTNAEPGALLTGPPLERCRQWRNQHEGTVAGMHFLPEDSSRDISQA